MDGFLKIDKLYHLVAGVIIGLLVTLISDSSVVGFLAAFWAGLGKEVYDYPRFDWRDWVTTIIGGCAAFLI